MKTGAIIWHLMMGLTISMSTLRAEGFAGTKIHNF